MTYAEDAINFEATKWRMEITRVKVYEATTKTIAGVSCRINQDSADSAKAEKLIGIQNGVKRVVDAGFDFPDGLHFYTSSVGGFQCVAYHRDLGDKRKAIVLLGPNAVNTAGMIGRLGVADVVGSQSASAYCEAVVVHELGHNLHERLAENYFWSKEANKIPNVNTAMKVSQYATTNRKEVVAEVFTGMLYGITYGPDVHRIYTEYNGMYPPDSSTGGRRRR